MTATLIGKSETSRLVGWEVSLRSIERLTFYRSAMAVSNAVKPGPPPGGLSCTQSTEETRVKRRKRTTITIETERLLVTSQSGLETAWCAECVEHVRMVSIDDAASLASLNALDIYRAADAAMLHFLETGGSLLICPTSLNDFARKLNRKTEREEL